MVQATLKIDDLNKHNSYLQKELNKYTILYNDEKLLREQTQEQSI